MIAQSFYKTLLCFWLEIKKICSVLMSIPLNKLSWSWHPVHISIQSFSDSTLDMDPIFGAISAVDHADCGKLLVCNVFAKTQNELTTEEDLLGKVTYTKY